MQGEVASREAFRPVTIAPIRLDETRSLLTACRYFALEKVSVDAGQSLFLVNPDSPQVLTLLSGAVSLRGGDGVELTPGSSGVTWPSADEVMLVATESSVLLRAWVPDLMADVGEPARAAGASDDAIVALGGMTDDLRAVTGR